MTEQPTGQSAGQPAGQQHKQPIRRALVSVSDKTGLPELGAALRDAEVQVVSTGSTAAVLAQAGVPVTPVSDVTGFPEAFDGRVKTLHPAVHGGLLADRRKPAHVEQMASLGIEAFDLVIVNLYPFREAVAAGAEGDDAVEQIDIGGPAMVRAAAKNHANVAVVVSPQHYPDVLRALVEGGFDLAQRQRLAAEAFAHTASYDIAVASWMTAQAPPEEGSSGFPGWIGGAWERAEVLRYGENPHQQAALYRSRDIAPGLAQARQLHGK